MSEKISLDSSEKYYKKIFRESDINPWKLTIIRFIYRDYVSVESWSFCL